MKATYRVEIQEVDGRVEVNVWNPRGAPFAGHADSTNSIPLESLLRFATSDILRDYLHERGRP